MKHSFSAKYKNILLRPIYENDLESLRIWRNDSNLSEYLTKLDYITPEMQKAWYKRDNEDKNTYTFAIAETHTIGRVIGSVALYNFYDTTAEFGRAMIGEPLARGKGYGFLATVLALQLGFECFNLQTITASVHEDNIAAIKAYEKSGFKICGKHQYKHDGYELEIIADKNLFVKLHSFLPEITVSQ